MSTYKLPTIATPAAVGPHEVVLVASPPEDASDVQAWLQTVTEGWIAHA